MVLWILMAFPSSYRADWWSALQGRPIPWSAGYTVTSSEPSAFYALVQIRETRIPWNSTFLQKT